MITLDKYEYTSRLFASNPRSVTNADYLTEYHKDYLSVLRSPSFRRLQNKTQLFPAQESDFFRNRLTHSLEVAQIAKSIAEKLLSDAEAQGISLELSPEVCEIAGLIHDIGHPPFGHNGERALDECMRSYGGFEGNAQTLRIVTRLEKKDPPTDNPLDSLTSEDLMKSLIGKDKDCRVGLNLTARVIASVLKYDSCIPISRRPEQPLQKGYYDSEKDIVETVKKCVVGNEHYSHFKTIECGIMDIADDIAYSTSDIEDAFKAGFLTPYDIIAADQWVFQRISDKLKDSEITASDSECRQALVGVFATMWKRPLDEFWEATHDKNYPVDDNQYQNKALNLLISVHQQSRKLASNGYFRTPFTSLMVNAFIRGVQLEVNREHSILSRVQLDENTKLRVNVLKHFSYEMLINSPRLRVSENRGQEMIKRMFEKLTTKNGRDLLPTDVQSLYNMAEFYRWAPDKRDEWHRRVICDFIAGMTDHYALEFYGRLFSENPQTIFKPL